MHKKLYLWAFATLITSGLACAQQEDNAATEEETFELSPFVVESTEDFGYLAASILAGTKLKTDLKNVGAAVSIYTEEYLDDIGADDI
ncbi:MAG: hypothetical protein ACO3ZW_09305 [Opitutales bacterium]|jgi:methylaspartate ammonia-lyase